MIDIRKLKELVRLMVAHDLVEIDLRDSEEQVTVRRPNPNVAPVVTHGAMAPPVVYAPAPVTPPIHATAGGQPTAVASPAMDEGLLAIESPMVGTFYAMPDPDSPVFISVGDPIGPGKVVCLIEAMKIFNEIKSEISGRVERILVKNGQAVEFGQKLFLVRPS